MERLDFSKQQIELLEGKSNWMTWKFRALIQLREIKRRLTLSREGFCHPNP